MTFNRLAFSLLALLLIVLIGATLFEKLYGTEAAAFHIYGSTWFTLLWALFASASLVYLLKRHLFRRPAVLLLHLSFIVILIGALVTHLWGEQGSVHLRKGDCLQAWSPMENTIEKNTRRLPFTLCLEDFEIRYYPGTQSPMDYMSTIKIDGTTFQVSMNRIARHKGYRFYQSGYDHDGRGAYLSICHDPWGIGITYTGYVMLLISMIFFLFSPQESFRRLLKDTRRHRNGTLCIASLFFCLPATSAGAAETSDNNFTDFPHAETPKVLPQDIAAQFGELHVLWNGRICPVQTLAREFVTKLYGRPTYAGHSAEQVFTGWIFYPSSWSRQPMIRIKGEAKSIIGLTKKYATWQELSDLQAGSKIKNALRTSGSNGSPRSFSAEEANRRTSIGEAEEKYNLILTHLGGKILRIYPARPDNSPSSPLRWFGQGDNLPPELPESQWLFIKKSLDYIGELVQKRDYAEVSEVLEKIHRYQLQQGGRELPSDGRFRAELLYNSLQCTRPLAMIFLALGLASSLLYIMGRLRPLPRKRALTKGCDIFIGIAILYLSCIAILRGYVGGHIPLANGYETMQFLALCTLILTLPLHRRFAPALPFGLLFCGLTLLVSMLGESNPQITPLMPVLASPLLSLHVAVIMLAYSLLAFTMSNALTAIILRQVSPHRAEPHLLQLQYISRLLLFPALFLLATGIFIGAVWANVSWGRYWGWDPKEVWALVTLLVYSLALHKESLPVFRRPLFFHVFILIAFLTVLMTYFGVNYLLGGMHSYANG